jgi:hypothetical protein
MQRRTVLGIGVVGAAVLVLAGAGAAWLYQPAWRDARLLPAGRRVLAGVARAVLDGSLPDADPARAEAIDGHLSRTESMLRMLPPHTQHEVARLLALLDVPPMRVALTGLRADWQQAPVGELQAALNSMRTSSSVMRRQVYAALRELTHAAYFADAATWPLLGYPGPTPLPS